MGKKIKIDPLGYKNPTNYGNPVIIPNNSITMNGITKPVLGISDAGDVQLMKPNQNYNFKGNNVLEVPMLSKGGKMKKRKKAQSGISVPKVFQKADEEMQQNFMLDNAQLAELSVPRASRSMESALGLVPQYLTDDINVNMNPLAKSKQKPNIGGMLQAGLYGVSAFMPSEKPRRQYVRPEDSDYYNPYSNGTGSQAIMQSGGVMQSPFSSSVPKAMTQEATRQGSMVVDPITQKLLDDKAHEQRKIQMFMQQNPNLDLASYTAQRQKELGTFNKDGDWIPNEQYKKPGRTQSYIESPTDMVVTNFAKKRHGGSMRQNSSYEDSGNMVLYNPNTSAEPISDNPFHSEMIEFKGPSHEDDGIPMAFSGQKVEVEGEETAFMDVEGNMQILGNMKNPLTGRLFKNDGKMIAKKEQTATKQYNKGMSLVEDNPMASLFDKISAKTGELKAKGATMKLGQLAQERETIARIQEEKLAMADALGVEPMKLDKMKGGGKMKLFVDMEHGGKLGGGKNELFAQSGATVDNSPIPDLQPNPTYVPRGLKKPTLPDYVTGNSAPPAAPSVTSTYNPIPNRESDAEALNPFSLSGELFTLATDRRQPVKMQKYNPMLEQDFEMSLEDQRQSVKDAFRTAMLQNRSNPAVQASLAGQMAEQLRGVDAQEFRINQENAARVYNSNRNTLNDAQWKNLGLGDEQYVRQEKADSITRLNRFNAFNSVSDKYLQKERDNNELKVYENLYNYRYNDDYQVQNQNTAPDFSNRGIVGSGQFNNTTPVPKVSTATKAVSNANGMLYPAPAPMLFQRKNMNEATGLSNDIIYKPTKLKKAKSGMRLAKEFKEYKG